MTPISLQAAGSERAGVEHSLAWTAGKAVTPSYQQGGEEAAVGTPPNPRALGCDALGGVGGAPWKYAAAGRRVVRLVLGSALWRRCGTPLVLKFG